MVLPDSYAFQQRQGFISVEIFYFSHFLNLLYHKLFSLSSIFFYFFQGFARPAVPFPELRGCGIIRLVHIYIPRNRTPRGGVIGIGLTRLSWVSPSGFAFPRPLCTYYSTLCGVCQELFFRFLIFLQGWGSLSLSTLRVYYSKKFFKLQVVKMYKISGGQKAKFVQNFLLTKYVTCGIMKKSRGPGRPRATQKFFKGNLFAKSQAVLFSA